MHRTKVSVMTTREYMAQGVAPPSRVPHLFYDAASDLSSIKKKLLGDDRDPLAVDPHGQELSSRLEDRLLNPFPGIRLY